MSAQASQKVNISAFEAANGLGGHEVTILTMSLFLESQDDQNEWSNIPNILFFGFRGRFRGLRGREAKNGLERKVIRISRRF